MAKDTITTYTEAAQEFGVSNDVITALAASRGIEPKPVPRCPNGKGLDARDMNTIRKALGLRKGEKVKFPGRTRQAAAAG